MRNLEVEIDTVVSHAADSEEQCIGVEQCDASTDFFAEERVAGYFLSDVESHARRAFENRLPLRHNRSTEEVFGVALQHRYPQNVAVLVGFPIVVGREQS